MDKGKVVKSTAAPATVIGYETNKYPLGNWEGVGTRIIHKPGYLQNNIASVGGIRHFVYKLTLI